MRNEILKKLTADIKQHTISGMVDKTKIPYTTLYRLVNKQGDCRYRTWEMLEKYYSKKQTSGAQEKAED